MSSEPNLKSEESNEPKSSPDGNTEQTIQELRAERDLLEEENRRLRTQYAETLRSAYRRAAIGLAVVGVAAIGGAVVFASTREVFVVIGAIGLFGAILTHYLSPDTVVSALVGDQIYTALSENERAIVAELGLSGDPTYVPTGTATESIRLFVPQESGQTVPVEEIAASTFVIGAEDAERGVSFEPSASRLYREFVQATDAERASDLNADAQRLSEALTELFEIADAVEPSVDIEDGRATFEIQGSSIGEVEGFDAPTVSFLGVGLVSMLNQPIRLVHSESTSDSSSGTVTFRWDPESDEETSNTET